eukprot:1161849-Pelagomonas_calceolata.AAC.1
MPSNACKSTLTGWHSAASVPCCQMMRATVERHLLSNACKSTLIGWHWGASDAEGTRLRLLRACVCVLVCICVRECVVYECACVSTHVCVLQECMLAGQPKN